MDTVDSDYSRDYIFFAIILQMGYDEWDILFEQFFVPVYS
jgi:hypothetical protein